MISTNTLVSATKDSSKAELANNLNTALPGRITDVKQFDRLRVTVKPLIKNVYWDGDELELRDITNVPLMLGYIVGDVIIKPPANSLVGTDVMVIFSQRSLDNYLSTGRLSTPKSRTKFSLSDGVAFPGLHSFVDPIDGLSNNNDLEIIYKGKGNITLKENGDVSINNDNLVVKP